jgi:hypothetical protein
MDLHARYRAATPYERRILDESLANAQRLHAGARKAAVAMEEHRRRQEAQRMEELRRFQAQQEAAVDLERRQFAAHQDALGRDEALRNAKEEPTRQYIDALTEQARLRAMSEQIRRAEIGRRMAINLPRLQAIRHARSQVGG